MESWLQFISIIASFGTLIGFLAVFVRMGKEKGEQEAVQKEMRKDIEENKKDIESLENTIQQMQVENTKLTTTLSNDLNWIKASLVEIKTEIKNRKE